MSWLLAQTSLTPPELEPVQRAFRATGIFHPLDAHSFLRDAFGVLAKNLSEEDARRLQGALAGEGVLTDVVAQAEWPVLPPAKRIVRAACDTEGFKPLDPLGRELRVPWDKVVLISAGQVQHTEFTADKNASPDPGSVGYFAAGMTDSLTGLLSRGGRGLGLRGDLQRLAASRPPSREEQNWRWTADVFLGGGLRFTFQGHEFNYTALGDRRQADSIANFAVFLREMTSLAPYTPLNRGAFALREAQSQPVRYPTRGAFQEESAWLLWRLLKAGRYAGPATA